MNTFNTKMLCETYIAITDDCSSCNRAKILWSRLGGGIVRFIISALFFCSALAHASILILDDNTSGRYNDGIGFLLNTNGSSDPFLCNDVACGDRSLRFSSAPSLSAAQDALGNWLSNPAAPGGFWSETKAIPRSWETNTETAIIYEFSTLTGMQNVQLELGVDNGVFVWLNGQYQFGALDGGGAQLGEYSVALGDIGPGTHYLQVLREDHGQATDYTIRMSGETANAQPTPRLFERRVADQSLIETVGSDGNGMPFATAKFDGTRFIYKMVFGIEGATVSQRIRDDWESGIEKMWNGYTLGGYKIEFDVAFVDIAQGGWDVRLPVADNFFCEWFSNRWCTNFHLYSQARDFDIDVAFGRAAAHEFGHYLGNWDEYSGSPGSDPNATSGQLCDRASMVGDYCNGLMADFAHGEMEERYLEDVVAYLSNESGIPDLRLASLPGYVPPPKLDGVVGLWILDGNTSIPEPSSMLLMLTCLGVLCAMTRRPS